MTLKFFQRKFPYRTFWGAIALICFLVGCRQLDTENPTFGDMDLPPPHDSVYAAQAIMNDPLYGVLEGVFSGESDYVFGQITIANIQRDTVVRIELAGEPNFADAQDIRIFWTLLEEAIAEKEQKYIVVLNGKMGISNTLRAADLNQ